MNLESVPAILNIAPKLLPMVEHFNRYRYFLLEGGRGGGKTQAVGRLVLVLADTSCLRIVAGRETMNSISESVYSVLRDLILTYALDFDVQASRIVSRRTGSTINFRGFREAGAFNIQGLEGVDVVWVDEAQALTKRTLDILIPTIRKDRAKLFFTMNRHIVDDPAYTFFVSRDDCLHIQVNYVDNPFCTAALRKEAEECKRLSEKDYQHIWMGAPLDQSEDAVFSVSDLEQAKRQNFPLQLGYGGRVAGFDIARFGQDKNACVILEQRGPLVWQMIHKAQWGKADLNFTTGKIYEIRNTFNVSLSIIDEDGLGSGPLDNLSRGRRLTDIRGFRNVILSAKENKDFVNNRTRWAYHLRDMVASGHIAISDEETIAELLSLKYDFRHDQRRILVSKEEMRNKGVKSPNLADALIYATSLITEVKDEQSRKYDSNTLPNYATDNWNPFSNAPDDNLFGIVGA